MLRKNSCIIFNIVLLTITAALWICGQNDTRYTTEQSVFSQDQFPGATADWILRGNTTSINIESDGIVVDNTGYSGSEETFVFQKMSLPQQEQLDAQEALNSGENYTENPNANERLIRIQSQIEITDTSDVSSPNPEKEKQAALMVWQYDANGEPIRYVTVKSFEGTRTHSHSVDRTLGVSNSASSVALAFMAKETKAVFQISALSAATVKGKTVIELLVKALWALYLLTLLVGAVILIRSIFSHGLNVKSMTTLAFIVMVFGLIVIGSTVSESVRITYLSGITNTIDHFKPSSLNQYSGQTLLFKTGHVLAFWLGTFTLLLIGRRAGLSTMCLLFFLCVFAVSTEIMQLYKIGRETRISDFGLDLTGALLGLGTYALLFRAKLGDDSNGIDTSSG